MDRPIESNEGFNPEQDMNEERVVSRKPEEMQRIIEDLEKRKISKPFLDEFGEELGEIDFDPQSGETIEIRTKPYVNVEQEAEHKDEHIYATDEQGKILRRRTTRKEARDKNMRYLVVSCLLFHGNEVLLQKRSEQKDIDPGKFSTSAHGVAKELFINGGRVPSVDLASLINTALEINEELKHGENTKQFTIRIWPGNEEELIAYARDRQLDDSGTVYIIPQALYPDDGYPLGVDGKKRTRAVTSGHIFSREKPNISIDQAELSEVSWMKPSEYFKMNDMTEDLQSVTDALADTILEKYFRSDKLGAYIISKLMNNKE